MQNKNIHKKHYEKDFLNENSPVGTIKQIAHEFIHGEEKVLIF